VIILSFAGETRDHVGADGGVWQSRGNPLQTPRVMLGAIPAVHRGENPVGRRLQRNVKVLRNARSGSDERDQVFGDVHGLDRAEAHALQRRALEDQAQQRKQIHARNQIAAVTAQMNSAQHDFAIAARDKNIQFVKDARRREAAAIAAHRRYDTKRAAMIAAVLDLERGPRVPRFAAFDGRNEHVGQREGIADENRRAARRGSEVRSGAERAERRHGNEVRASGRRFGGGESSAEFREPRNLRLMRIADDVRHAGKGGEIFRRALRIATRGDDARGWICAMDGPDRAARLRIGRRCDGASVHDDDVRRGRDGRDIETARKQLALDGGGIGLRGAATELFDEKSGHTCRERRRKGHHYNNARAAAREFLLPDARDLPQDDFFAKDMPLHLIAIALGAVVGVLVGFMGVGGGVVLIPVMVYLLHFDQHVAQGTSLLMQIPPLGIGALLVYWRRREVDLIAGILCALGFLLGGYFGSVLAIGIASRQLRAYFALFQMVAAVLLWRRKHKHAAPPPEAADAA